MITKDSIPDGWTWTSVGRSFAFTGKPRNLDVGAHPAVPFIPMDLIPIHRLHASDHILKVPANLTSGTYFENGDLLVSKITPCFENGKQAIITGLPLPFGYATTEVIPLKAIAGVSDLQFLFYYLMEPSVRAELAGRMEGATGRQRLSKSALEAWEMALPPLDEQRTIVESLTLIFDAIEVQDRTVATLKELRTAMMEMLFEVGANHSKSKSTPIGNIPCGWDIVPIESLVTNAQYGLSIRGEKTGKYPILRMNCQQDGRVVMRNLQYVDVDQSLLEAFRLKNGDLLFNRTNSYELVGRTAIFSGHGQDVVFASYLVRLTPNTLVNPRFLNYYLNLASTQAALKGLATRAVGQANISASKLKAFFAPLPKTMQEQDRIADILDELTDRIVAAEEKRTGLASAFDSALQSLMSGSLRTTPLLAG